MYDKRKSRPYNNLVSKYGNIREMEKKVRSSQSYARWVERNKAVACYGCNATENLECHHVPDLYSVILGLWKIFGNEEEAVSHAISMHDDDRVENITFCSECHGKKHPGRSSATKYRYKIAADNWTTIPRKIGFPFCHSTVAMTKHSVGLVGFQTLLAIGWYVLNGHTESKMLCLNRRRVAELIGKSAGTSFNRSFNNAIRSLSGLGILNAAHQNMNDVELHLSPDYLNRLRENPWFMPMDEVKTSNMCSLTLRWFLGTQSNVRTYKIGLDKLKTHLGITVRNDSMAVKAIRRACEEISWVKFGIHDGMCSFVISRRGATPIFQLRQVLNDSIEQAT